MIYNFRDELKTTLENSFQPFLFENDFKCVIPESFLILASLFFLIYGVIYGSSKRSNYPILINNVSWLTLLSLFFTMVLLSNSPLNRGMLFFNSLVIDDFTFFLKMTLLAGAFFSIFISLDYVQQENLNSFELIILIGISTASMLFLISAADFISMYLAIELQSLCFYVMAALKRNSEFSTEAGLKYFLLGAFSSGILLFGSSLIYGFTGSTNFSELSKIYVCGGEDLVMGVKQSGLIGSLSSLQGFELGMIFILVGFLFKLTAAPFHMWAPDVYEGAPTSVTAFFSIVPKVSILGAFIRLFYSGFYDLMADQGNLLVPIPWQNLIFFCSIASMVGGALAALSQNKIKRLLAFSSIGHVGYLLVGFCCGTLEGIQALLIYLVIYIVMTINLFTIILSPVRRESFGATQFNVQSSITPQSSTYSKAAKKASSLLNFKGSNVFTPISELYTEKSIQGIQGKHTSSVIPAPNTAQSRENFTQPLQRIKFTTDLAMLAKTNPILAITLTVTMFSIAGIPPLAGFYSKAFLMFAAMSSSQYLLAFIGVVTSVISCFYYIRVVKIMYFESPNNWLSFMQISKESSLALGCTFFFLLLFFLYPAPLFIGTHKAAIYLCF